MSGDIFARGPIDRGYGPAHVTEVAEVIEACVQDALRRQEKRERRRKRFFLFF